MHLKCMGHVKDGSRSIGVARAAGVYPLQLTRRWAELVAEEAQKEARVRPKRRQPGGSSPGPGPPELGGGVSPR